MCYKELNSREKDKDMAKYRFFSDPAHGWLEIPRAELRELGILSDISGYSYQSENGSMVYLEEDCDTLNPCGQ